jgi:hypothetical protein
LFLHLFFGLFVCFGFFLRFLFFLACLSRARFSRPSPIFFRTLLLSSTLCCDQNATWVSLIVFISTSNQANKERS